MRVHYHVTAAARALVARAPPHATSTCARHYCLRSPVLNHFETLKLSPQYDIDDEALTARFRQLQNVTHPDKFSNKPEAEQNSASERSSAINEAYSVLKDPLARSVHLLHLAGFPLQEDASDADAQFLAEVMEINEQLAAVSSPTQLLTVKQNNLRILHSLYSSMAEAFQARNYVRAREIAYKIKYYANIDEKVRNYEMEHNIM